MSRSPCFNCDEVPSYYSQKCRECGYKFLEVAAQDIPDDESTETRWRDNYRFMLLIGAALAYSGIGALALSFPALAVALVGLGMTVFLAGVVGTWWNKQ